MILENESVLMGKMRLVLRLLQKFGSILFLFIIIIILCSWK